MTPYQLAAVDYAGFGWSPIPLPPSEKSPPPDDYTGADGTWVGLIQAEEWRQPRARYKAGKVHFVCGNIALRLPRNVLGIDVDAYDGRSGGATLAKAEEAWGALPDTWMSSSRRDGSGIRLFQIPEGLAWPESLRKFHGGGVDLIRWDHRYAIVFPSIHDKTGQRYQWCSPDGEWVTDEVPDVESLAVLPQAWVDGLTSGREWTERAAMEMDAEDVKAWLADRRSGEPCAAMEKTLSQYTRLVRQAGDDGGAHDEVRNGAWALVGDAAAGHSGVLDALGKLRDVFLAAVKGRRSTRQARDEWGRILTRGVQKVAGEGEVSDSCACEQIAQWTPERISRTGSGAFDYVRDDIGNAQRLVNWCGEDMRFIEGLGGWHVWTGKRWELDRNGQVHRWAFEMVRDMEREANFIEDTKSRAAFVAWIRSSGGQGKIRAMIELSSRMRGMTLNASEFDSDPTAMLCPNGVLELRDDGVRFRPVERTDRITLMTRAEYVPDATHELWDKFLGHAVPDEATRRWLQKALGYSLFGGNPARYFFLIRGETSSGKTTLAEAVRYALGDYAAPFNLSLFRVVKEQGANVQLVRLLGRRFIVASEASEDWYLHADEIKRITGGDAISARLNHANDMIEAVPAFTPWIVTNSAPTIKGADLALYRRMWTIPFDETIGADAEDTSVRLRLQSSECGAAVLAWLVEGWRAYCAERLLDAPPAVVEATLKTREELSEFDVFLKEYCIQEVDASVLAKDLYAAYESWCSRNGTRPESSVLFGRSLSKRGFDRRVIRQGEKVSRARRGIRLNAWAMKEVSGTDLTGSEE